MSRRLLKLESFEPEEAPKTEAHDQVAFEEARLAAFEKGYSAGWDDAVEAQNAEAARFRSELGESLQKMSFTYHEARRHVLDAVKPLLVDMAAKVLPTIARQSLPLMVADQLAPLAESLSLAPITVVANPAVLPQIRAVLAERPILPLTFVADPELGEGQVHLRLDEAETKIDLDGVIQMISSAVATYFNANEEEPNHG